MNPAHAIAAILLQDPGGRGIGGLVDPEELAVSLGGAAEVLRAARSVAIVTGFPVPVGTTQVPETDGPPGSAVLAGTLGRLGVSACVITDTCCGAVVRAAAAVVAARWGVDVPVVEADHPAEIRRSPPDVLVFVERPGRAADGTCYSMRGRPLAGVAPLDRLGETWPEACVIGIGDGGNEAGMGSLRSRVARSVPLGGQVGAVVPARFPLVAGTSNWGAYGLAVALQVRSGCPGIPPGCLVDIERALLRACVAAGAVDGVVGAPQETVDGLDADTYLGALAALEEVLRPGGREVS